VGGEDDIESMAGGSVQRMDEGADTCLSSSEGGGEGQGVGDMAEKMVDLMDGCDQEEARPGEGGEGGNVGGLGDVGGSEAEGTDIHTHKHRYTHTQAHTCTHTHVHTYTNTDTQQWMWRRHVDRT